MSNSTLIKSFNALGENRQKQGELYRAKAYFRARDFCQDYPEKLTSMEQIEDIKGFGPKIKQVFRQYFESMNSSSSEEDEDLLNYFQQIEGVGPVTAKKWIQQGYETIADLDLSELTSAQRIGVKYFNDLNQRIPREEIKAFERSLRRYLRRDQINFIIAGSYRRGAKTSGDIDILVPSQSKKTLDLVLRCPLFTETLAHGKKKWRGVGRIKNRVRRIDIEIVQPKEYPFALLYFTGSANHNVQMRETARKFGYRLNEKSLTRNDGQSVEADLKTEYDIYRFLGIQYKSPEKRT